MKLWLWRWLRRASEPGVKFMVVSIFFPVFAALETASVRYVVVGVFLGISLAILGAGCLAPSAASRGYPLYTVSGDRPSVSQVATLGVTTRGGSATARGSSIFVKKVDGQDVSELGATFELLPGCHVVETELPARSRDPSDTVGPPAFVFPMQAGHAYTIVVELLESRVGWGWARRSFYGVEQDSRWQRTATFQPVKPETAACAPRANSP